MRRKTTCQPTIYNDGESSGNGKNAGTFEKSVFFLYCLYDTLPSETLISDSPSSTKASEGNATWGQSAILCLEQTELFSHLCLGPTCLVQVKPSSVSPCGKLR